MKLYLAALFVGYLLYRFIIHPAFLSPLSKLPAAHPTSHFTSAWLVWKKRQGLEARSISAAHQRCGTVVRMAPNEVSVTSHDGLRKVYYGTFSRTKWILAFLNYNGTPNMITMLNNRDHMIRKRIVSGLYSKSYLLGSPDFRVLSRVVLFDRLMPILNKAATDGAGIEMLELGSALAVDFMSAYLFGIANSVNLTGLGREAARTRHVENGKKKLRNLKGADVAGKELEDEIFALCLKADQLVKNEKFSREKATDEEHTQTTQPVVFAQLRASIPEKEGVTDETTLLRLMASEVIDSLEAARVAIGNALVYITHELSQRPELQSRLRAELLAISPPLVQAGPGLPAVTKPTLQQLDGRPLLDAVVMETLRLRAPSPTPLYRLVPDGGVVVDGHFVPAGVSISASPYALHRLASVFPDPEQWRPERWLKERPAKDEADVEGGGGADDLRRWMYAFGQGGKMCVGSNFALLGEFSLYNQMCFLRPDWRVAFCGLRKKEVSWVTLHC